MADIHLTRELLRAVSRGELPPRLLLQVGLQHLTNLCPTCQSEMEAWQHERGSTLYDYTQAFQILPSLISQQVPRVAKERRAAERDLRLLLKLPVEERPARIKRARNRFRGASLAQLLIEESRKHFTTDPREGIHLAELARTVIHHTPNAPGAFDLIALATSYMANSARASGDLRLAAQHFGHARYIITHEGVTDPEVLGRIDELEGSLRKDQRLFREAEELLRRAVMLFRLAGAAVDQARVLLVLGVTYNLQGKPKQAIETTEAALTKIQPETNLHLYACGRYNLARFLIELRKYREAEILIAADYDLYHKLREPWTQLRLAWLRGKIAAGRGRNEQAERALLEARDGFIRLGIGFDAAMVSVEDLAPLYLQAGRTAEVKRLAEEMLPIFTATDVHREALAALMYFVEAARRERVTAKLARNVALFLRDARADPSLRFSKEEPS